MTQPLEIAKQMMEALENIIAELDSPLISDLEVGYLHRGLTPREIAGRLTERHKSVTHMAQQILAHAPELLKHLEGMQWQSVDSAPKNRKILISTANGDVHAAYTNNGTNFYHSWDNSPINGALLWIDVPYPPKAGE